MIWKFSILPYDKWPLIVSRCLESNLFRSIRFWLSVFCRDTILNMRLSTYRFGVRYAHVQMFTCSGLQSGSCYCCREGHTHSSTGAVYYVDRWMTPRSVSIPTMLNHEQKTNITDWMLTIGYTIHDSHFWLTTGYLFDSNDQKLFTSLLSFKWIHIQWYTLWFRNHAGISKQLFPYKCIEMPLFRSMTRLC